MVPQIQISLQTMQVINSCWENPFEACWLSETIIICQGHLNERQFGCLNQQYLSLLGNFNTRKVSLYS